MTANSRMQKNNIDNKRPTGQVQHGTERTRSGAFLTSIHVSRNKNCPELYSILGMILVPWAGFDTKKKKLQRFEYLHDGPRMLFNNR